MLTIVSILVIWVEDNHHCLHSDDLCGRDDKNNHSVKEIICEKRENMDEKRLI